MYKKELELQDNEVAAKINRETGEITPVGSSIKRNPNISNFENGKFIKHHVAAWKLLSTQLSNIEYSIASKMSNMIKMVTNSLQPLSDDMTKSEIAAEFNISRNSVTAIFEKLFKLGVYARFEISEYDEDFHHRKYWVFNPYLSCNGAAIDNRSKGLFANTMYAKLS